MRAILTTLLLVLCVPTAAQIDTVPVGPRGPIPTEDTCLPVRNGFVVWRGSPNCYPATTQLNVPTADRVGLIRYRTVQVISADLADGVLQSPLSSSERGWVLSRAQDMEPVFLDRGLYGAWNLPPGWTPNCGQYWCGCAQGVGTWPPQVDASQSPGQTEQLLAWEYTNAILGALGMPSLFDSTYITTVLSRVGPQVGGWSSQ